MGQCLDKNLEVHRALQEAFCKKDDTPQSVTSTHRLMHIPESDSHEELKDLYPTFLKNFAAEVDRAAGLDGTRRLTPLELLTGLPPDLPCFSMVEAFTVPDSDPREGLRGEQGVRVAADAPHGLVAGDFVAVYRGHAMLGINEFGGEDDQANAQSLLGVKRAVIADEEVISPAAPLASFVSPAGRPVSRGLPPREQLLAKTPEVFNGRYIILPRAVLNIVNVGKPEKGRPWFPKSFMDHTWSNTNFKSTWNFTLKRMNVREGPVKMNLAPGGKDYIDFFNLGRRRYDCPIAHPG